MDLKTISHQLATSTHDLHILSPEGHPLFATEVKGKPELTTEETGRPLVFKIVGQDSAAFRRRAAEVFNWSQGNRKKKVKFNDAEQQSLQTVASAIVGWENVVWDGEELPFNIDNVMIVIDGYRPAFEQVDEAIADRANFMKSGAAS